jgi:hypothetical protein
MPAEPAKSFDASGAEIFKHPIDARARIGHVHLKVADIDRALAFYCGVLGFALVSRYGAEAAFIAAGDYHHHIGLNTWEDRRRRAGRRACFIWPSSIRQEPPSPTRCAVWRPPALRSTARPTMASAKRSICAIRMRTASNSIGIARTKNGRNHRKAGFRCTRVGSISKDC